MPPTRLGRPALDFALAHAEKYGDTDLFPQPFEYVAIRAQWEDKILPWFLKQDVGSWQPRPSRRIITPKASAGYRLSTQLDPLDSLFYTALVYSLAPEIEKARVPASQSVALAHRFRRNSSGDMWKRGGNWDDFQKRCGELAARREIQSVLKADIADFYARIYHHRLENRLFEVSKQPVFVRALMRLLEAWNGRVSYGIPIGQAASRLLAELVLDDVDRNLIDEGLLHCRWIDDYRIFCKSKRDAHRAESFLTKALSESHGLSLQQSKTFVLPKYAFEAELEDQQTVRIAVNARTREIIEEGQDVVEFDPDFGDLDDYERASLAPMEYEQLPANIKALVTRFSIDEVLRYLVAKAEPNLGLIRVLLGKLRDDEDDSACDIVLESLEELNPVLPDAIGYLIGIQAILAPAKRTTIGKICIELLGNSALRDSEYSTMWLLWLFAESSTFDNEATFGALYNEFQSQEARRKVILALGNAGNAGWFRMRRNDLAALPPWNRRAFLFGARCMLPDEREHWYKSVRAQLDELDVAVVDYAKNIGVKK